MECHREGGCHQVMPWVEQGCVTAWKGKRAALMFPGTALPYNSIGSQQLAKWPLTS